MTANRSRFLRVSSRTCLVVYNPHLHVLISDGCFHPSGILRVSPAIDTPCIEELFRHKVLKLLLSQGRITEATIAVAYILEP